MYIDKVDKGKGNLSISCGWVHEELNRAYAEGCEETKSLRLEDKRKHVRRYVALRLKK